MIALDHYAQTPDGLLMIANGMGPMLIWDGLATVAEEAGLAAPATALTVGGAGAGNIVGDYTAYQRFVDRRGNVSNLSPISNTYSALGALTGNVEDATNSTPIVVTSTAHGLSTGNVVLIADVLGNLGANGSWVITVLSANTFALDDSVGSGDYAGEGTWTSGINQINYSSVPIPTSSKVVRRQILRNTAGQTATYYIDVDSTDLAATTFNSVKTDAVLAAGTAVPIFNPDGSLNANAHGVPPNHKRVLAHHQGRMFATGEVTYTQGAVILANSSATVTGINTDWTDELDGRYLWAIGGDKEYEIDSVNEAAQTLTLAENYGGTSSPYGIYAIRPAPAERRLIYYTEAGLPESWPSVNALSIQEDGDELTGLLVMGSFLYILERRHIYRFTFQEDPGVDGAAFIATVRGCINNRTWVVVEDSAYCLDQQGIHRFGGNEQPEPISAPIQSLFDPTGTGGPSIHWAAAEQFHACLYPAAETIRWFVCLSGQTYPRHALCFNYRNESWWIEEYQRPIASSCTATLRGNRRTLVGADARKVLLLAEGTLDGVRASDGTVRGSPTALDTLHLTDGLATFSSDLVGTTLVIVSGTGRGQRRTIIEVDGTTLTLSMPWLVEPDTTSVYQIGGIPWSYVSKWLCFEETESNSPSKVGVAYQPTRHAANLDLEFMEDYDDTAVVSRSRNRAGDAEGFAVAKDDSVFTADMQRTDSRTGGWVQQRFGRHKERAIPGRRFFSLKLAGVSNQDQVRVYRVEVHGSIER